jgi:hypothetical protein
VQCGFDLRESTAIKADQQALAFQHQADHVIEADKALWLGGALLDSKSWFANVRRLAGAALSEIAADPDVASSVALGLPLELQSVRERHLRFAVVGRRLSCGSGPSLFEPRTRSDQDAEPSEHAAVQAAWLRFLRRRAYAGDL